MRIIKVKIPTRMKIRPLIAILVIASSINAMAQRATKLTASKANDYGIAYSLPNTVFDIVIEAQFVERQPGEFANYASLYLNASKAITAPQYAASVKSVTVVPRGVPSEDNRWLIDFKGSGITYVMLNEAGVPVAINTENLPGEAAVPALPKAKKADPTPLETEAAQYAITQDMISSTSVAKRAQLASQRIFDLREIRSDLISGNAENTPPDGESMQLMLNNVAAQEAALNAMFVGTEKTWTDVKTVTYTPMGESESAPVIIARVSPVKGIVAPEDLSGFPVYLNFEVLTTGELSTADGPESKKAPKEGVAYTIPGTAQLTITCDGTQLLSQEYEVAQLGSTYFLDPKLFTDKKKPAFVIFNPLTGGLREVGTLAPKE